MNKNFSGSDTEKNDNCLTEKTISKKFSSSSQIKYSKDFLTSDRRRRSPILRLRRLDYDFDRSEISEATGVKTRNSCKQLLPSAGPESTANQTHSEVSSENSPQFPSAKTKANSETSSTVSAENSGIKLRSNKSCIANESDDHRSRTNISKSVHQTKQFHRRERNKTADLPRSRSASIRNQSKSSAKTTFKYPLTLRSRSESLNPLKSNRTRAASVATPTIIEDRSFRLNKQQLVKQEEGCKPRISNLYSKHREIRQLGAAKHRSTLENFCNRRNNIENYQAVDVKIEPLDSCMFQGISPTSSQCTRSPFALVLLTDQDCHEAASAVGHSTSEKRNRSKSFQKLRNIELGELPPPLKSVKSSSEPNNPISDLSAEQIKSMQQRPTFERASSGGGRDCLPFPSLDSKPDVRNGNRYKQSTPHPSLTNRYHRILAKPPPPHTRQYVPMVAPTGRGHGSLVSPNAADLSSAPTYHHPTKHDLQSTASFEDGQGTHQPIRKRRVFWTSPPGDVLDPENDSLSDVGTVTTSLAKSSTESMVKPSNHRSLASLSVHPSPIASIIDSMTLRAPKTLEEPSSTTAATEREYSNKQNIDYFPESTFWEMPVKSNQNAFQSSQDDQKHYPMQVQYDSASSPIILNTFSLASAAQKIVKTDSDISESNPDSSTNLPKTASLTTPISAADRDHNSLSKIGAKSNLKNFRRNAEMRRDMWKNKLDLLYAGFRESEITSPETPETCKKLRGTAVLHLDDARSDKGDPYNFVPSPKLSTSSSADATSEVGRDIARLEAREPNKNRVKMSNVYESNFSESERVPKLRYPTHVETSAKTDLPIADVGSNTKHIISNEPSNIDKVFGSKLTTIPGGYTNSSVDDPGVEFCNLQDDLNRSSSSIVTSTNSLVLPKISIDKEVIESGGTIANQASQENILDQSTDPHMESSKGTLKHRLDSSSMDLTQNVSRSGPTLTRVCKPPNAYCDNTVLDEDLRFDFPPGSQPQRSTDPQFHEPEPLNSKATTTYQSKATSGDQPGACQHKSSKLVDPLNKHLIKHSVQPSKSLAVPQSNQPIGSLIHNDRISWYTVAATTSRADSQATTPPPPVHSSALLRSPQISGNLTNSFSGSILVTDNSQAQTGKFSQANPSLTWGFTRAFSTGTPAAYVGSSTEITKSSAAHYGSVDFENINSAPPSDKPTSVIEPVHCHVSQTSPIECLSPELTDYPLVIDEQCNETWKADTNASMISGSKSTANAGYFNNDQSYFHCSTAAEVCKPTFTPSSLTENSNPSGDNYSPYCRSNIDRIVSSLSLQEDDAAMSDDVDDQITSTIIVRKAELELSNTDKDLESTSDQFEVTDPLGLIDQPIVVLENLEDGTFQVTNSSTQSTLAATFSVQKATDRTCSTSNWSDSDDLITKKLQFHKNPQPALSPESANQSPTISNSKDHNSQLSTAILPRPLCDNKTSRVAWLKVTPDSLDSASVEMTQTGVQDIPSSFGRISIQSAYSNSSLRDESPGRPIVPEKRSGPIIDQPGRVADVDSGNQELQRTTDDGTSCGEDVRSGRLEDGNAHHDKAARGLGPKSDKPEAMDTNGNAFNPSFVNWNRISKNAMTMKYSRRKDLARPPRARSAELISPSEELDMSSLDFNSNSYQPHPVRPHLAELDGASQEHPKQVKSKRDPNANFSKPYKVNSCPDKKHSSKKGVTVRAEIEEQPQSPPSSSRSKTSATRGSPCSTQALLQNDPNNLQSYVEEVDVEKLGEANVIAEYSAFGWKAMSPSDCSGLELEDVDVDDDHRDSNIVDVATPLHDEGCQTENNDAGEDSDQDESRSKDSSRMVSSSGIPMHSGREESGIVHSSSSWQQLKDDFSDGSCHHSDEKATCTREDLLETTSSNNSTTSDSDHVPKIELSVVESPKVFGVASDDTASGNKHIHEQISLASEERIIERHIVQIGSMDSSKRFPESTGYIVNALTSVMAPSDRRSAPPVINISDDIQTKMPEYTSSKQDYLLNRSIESNSPVRKPIATTAGVCGQTAMISNYYQEPLKLDFLLTSNAITNIPPISPLKPTVALAHAAASKMYSPESSIYPVAPVREHYSKPNQSPPYPLENLQADDSLDSKRRGSFSGSLIGPPKKRFLFSNEFNQSPYHQELSSATSIWPENHRTYPASNESLLASNGNMFTRPTSVEKRKRKEYLTAKKKAALLAASNEAAIGSSPGGMDQVSVIKHVSVGSKYSGTLVQTNESLMSASAEGARAPPDAATFPGFPPPFYSPLQLNLNPTTYLNLGESNISSEYNPASQKSTPSSVPVFNPRCSSVETIAYDTTTGGSTSSQPHDSSRGMPGRKPGSANTANLSSMDPKRSHQLFPPTSYALGGPLLTSANSILNQQYFHHKNIPRSYYAPPSEMRGFPPSHVPLDSGGFSFRQPVTVPSLPHNLPAYMYSSIAGPYRHPLYPVPGSLQSAPPSSSSVAKAKVPKATSNGTSQSEELPPSMTEPSSITAPSPSQNACLPFRRGSLPSGPVVNSVIKEIKTLPQGECFQLALTSWEWASIDSVQLPCVFRNSERFTAVHIVQMKLLSKFPPNVPQELMRKHRMVSHKMSVLESWIFNTVNAMNCKYEFGFQLFTPNEEIVRAADVEKFYWAVKGFNLTRMADVYRMEIRATAELHHVLAAHISHLKAQTDAELKILQRSWEDRSALQSQDKAPLGEPPISSSQRKSPSPTTSASASRSSILRYIPSSRSTSATSQSGTSATVSINTSNASGGISARELYTSQFHKANPQPSATQSGANLPLTQQASLSKNAAAKATHYPIACQYSQQTAQLHSSQFQNLQHAQNQHQQSSSHPQSMDNSPSAIYAQHAAAVAAAAAAANHNSPFPPVGAPGSGHMMEELSPAAAAHYNAAMRYSNIPCNIHHGDGPSVAAAQAAAVQAAAAAANNSLSSHHHQQSNIFNSVQAAYAAHHLMGLPPSAAAVAAAHHYGPAPGCVSGYSGNHPSAPGAFSPSVFSRHGSAAAAAAAAAHINLPYGLHEPLNGSVPASRRASTLSRI